MKANFNNLILLPTILPLFLKAEIKEISNLF
jgi:hypothetical protein